MVDRQNRPAGAAIQPAHAGGNFFAGRGGGSLLPYRLLVS